jgi:hypothetical protein
MNRPPNYKEIDGYRYQLDRWWYNDDYTVFICEYVPEDDIPYIDQRKFINIPVE